MPLLPFALSLLLTTAAPATPPADSIALHRYTAGAVSYDVNAFWLESPQGVVLIDALFLGSDAKLLAGAIRASGKPLVAILLTHPHVDHFGGVTALRREFPGARLYATAATAREIQVTHDRGIEAGWLGAMAPDYGGPVTPDSLVAPGTTLTLAGIQFRIEDLGAAEAANNSVIAVPALNALFTGDLTVAHAPVYIGEGHVDQLLTALDRLAAMFPDSITAYSGHYAAMPLGQVVRDNRAQVRQVVGLVERAFGDKASQGPDGALRRTAVRPLVQAVAALYQPLATYGLDPATMAQMNIPGVMQARGFRVAPAGGQ